MSVEEASTDLSLLAPGFRAAVEAAVAACNDPARPGGALPVKVAEALRTNARQEWLYDQGRGRPGPIVTNAKTSLNSWHGFGLAVDVIHKTKAYWPFGNTPAAAAKNEAWFAEVAEVFKAHGCKWGGDWTTPDTPHMQWGRCKKSPSNVARTLLAEGGLPAVWNEVGAA